MNDSEQYLWKNFIAVIDRFHEGLIIINQKNDQILHSNESARNIYHGGLSSKTSTILKISDFAKKKFKQVDLELGLNLTEQSDEDSEDAAPKPTLATKLINAHLRRQKTIDRPETRRKSKLGLFANDVNLIKEGDKVSLKEILGGMNQQKMFGKNFTSSEIFRVCLPKVLKKKESVKDEQKHLITHVMFEALLIEFKGEKAIAVYMRDKTHFVKMGKATDEVERLKKAKPHVKVPNVSSLKQMVDEDGTLTETEPKKLKPKKVAFNTPMKKTQSASTPKIAINSSLLDLINKNKQILQEEMDMKYEQKKRDDEAAILAKKASKEESAKRMKNFKASFDNSMQRAFTNMILKHVEIMQADARRMDPNSLDNFIKPDYEDQIHVGERSWCPEDESHNAFKSLIIEAFNNTDFSTLNHVAHNLARKCIEWFGTPGGDNYTTIVVILKTNDYVHDQRFLEVWGSYGEYILNNEYVLVFKDGLREGEEPIENLQHCLKVFGEQKDAVCQIVN